MKFLTAALFLAGTFVLEAQFDVASLTGTLTDSTGAAIARASVAAIHEATNVETATVTGLTTPASLTVTVAVARLMLSLCSVQPTLPSALGQ